MPRGGSARVDIAAYGAAAGATASASPATVVEARWPASASACLSAETIRPRTSPRIAEAHFGLGGMDVDVDEGRIAFQEQRQRRMAVAREEIRIGAAHRADQQLVAHRPAVDEQELHRAVGAVVGRQAREAREPHALALDVDRRGVVAEIAAHDAARGGSSRPLNEIRFRLQIERAASVERQRERDIGPRHREALDHIERRQVFGARGFQEFEPRRRRVEQLAHLDARAVLAAWRGTPPARAQRRAAVDADLVRLARRRCGWRSKAAPPRRSTAAPRRGSPSSRCAERSSSARASTSRGARRRARDRPRSMPSPSSSTRIRSAPPADTAMSMRVAPGVERVLDQLLHGAGRPLDHLARGDAVDRAFGEPANLHARSYPPLEGGSKREALRGGVFHRSWTPPRKILRYARIFRPSLKGRVYLP